VKRSVVRPCSRDKVFLVVWLKNTLSACTQRCGRNLSFAEPQLPKPLAAFQGVRPWHRREAPLSSGVFTAFLLCSK